MKPVSLLALSFIAILSACGGGDANASLSSSSNSNRAVYEAHENEPSAPDTLRAAPAAVTDAKSGVLKRNISLAESTAATVDTAPSDRKIIRNAELNLEADDPEDAQRKITAVAELKGGFVVESQQSTSDMKVNSRDIVGMTVRVPAERFSETLADIRNISSRVVTETVKGQDVTEEFIDIEAQIKAKKALEAQFMEIMKRANTVGDALSVQSQLADVRGEIERVEGRKRFLENQSSLSTIKIRLQTAKVFAAATVSFGDRLSQSFMAGADVAVGFVLGLVTVVVAILPFALFIGLPVFALIRYVWKQQISPRSVVELAEDELKST